MIKYLISKTNFLVSLFTDVKVVILNVIIWVREKGVIFSTFFTFQTLTQIIYNVRREEMT